MTTETAGGLPPWPDRLGAPETATSSRSLTPETEAEFLQGLLREAGVGSVVRRAPGFDVPEFLAAGPRHVLVAASDVPVEQDVLREVDPGQSEPPSRPGADRRSRVLAGLLIPVALVVLVICLETDVLV